MREAEQAEIKSESDTALMQEDGGSFVAVGLLHLVGKGGVPALLKQRGYDVEKLY